MRQKVKLGARRISTLTKLRNCRKAPKIKLYIKDRRQINTEKIKNNIFISHQQNEGQSHNTRKANKSAVDKAKFKRFWTKVKLKNDIRKGIKGRTFSSLAFCCQFKNIFTFGIVFRNLEANYTESIILQYYVSCSLGVIFAHWVLREITRTSMRLECWRAYRKLEKSKYLIFILQKCMYYFCQPTKRRITG